jgi:hypothetical protein
MNDFDKWFDVSQQFNELFECTFEPDPRIVELERRCKELYDAPDEGYVFECRRFAQWCKDCGYTRDEIQRARQEVSSLR